MLNLSNSSNFTPHIRWMASTSTWMKSTDDGIVEVQIPLAIYDLKNIKTGWVVFAEGEAPEWILDPNLNENAPKPDDGRLWKRGFTVAVYSETYLDGEREFATSATGACRAISALHDEYLKQADNNPGMVPVVKFSGATPTQIGKGHTNVPILTIEKWVPRPGALKNGEDNPAAPKQPDTSVPWDEALSTETDDEF
jgi:hypothetical protein